MKRPVMEDGNSGIFQHLGHPVADGEHIVVFVQGPPGGGLLVSFPGFGVALRGVGVDDQHGGLRAVQIPGQGLFQQGGNVRVLDRAVGQVHLLLTGKGGNWCLRRGRFQEIRRKNRLRC